MRPIRGRDWKTSGGSLAPQACCPGGIAVATTRGWLSAGTTQPSLRKAEPGMIQFTVLFDINAALRLEGDDDNDLFIVRAFALAETSSEADGTVTLSGGTVYDGIGVA